MSETPYRSNAELREEIANLRRMVEALQYRDDPARFQSELEDIIRAQHAIEQIFHLLREINPAMLHINPDEGRVMLGWCFQSMNEVKRALRHQYHNVFPNLQFRHQPDPMMELLKEIGRMSKEPQSDFEI